MTAIIKLSISQVPPGGEPVKLSLKELKRIGIFLFIFIFFSISSYSYKLCDLEKILEPYMIAVGHERVYILEESSVIHIYSLEGFKYVKSFGRGGQGPGEFSAILIFKILPDSLFFLDMNKVVYYTKDGAFIKEKRIHPWISKLMPVGDNYIAQNRNFKKKNEPIKICLIDKDFNILKTIGEDRPLTILLNNIFKSGKQDYLAFRHYGGYAVFKDLIYIADTSKGFYFEVYNNKGDKLYEINKEYEKKEVTAKDKEEYMARERKSIYWERRKKRRNYIFPKLFPAFEYFSIYDNYIYVFTHQVKNKRKEIIIMDLKGKILKKTTLPLVDRYYIYNNRFYFLYENEDDEMWELHSEKVL
jgi:hypothetical protein